MNVPRQYESLRDYLAFLAARAQLHRIAVEVDADEELAALTNRVSKSKTGGPALLFEHVTGSNWPLTTNLFGSLQRSAWALGAETLTDLSARFRADLSRCDADRAAQRLSQLVAGTEFSPTLVEDPVCREVVEREKIDLTTLPLLRNFPKDGGKYLTLPLVFTADPTTGQSNCGIYRVQIASQDTLLVHWRADSDGGRNYLKGVASGKRMPVTIALGGDPALLFSAAMRLPAEISETAFAGYLRDSPVQVARCLTNRLAVPATAEIILEGEIVPEAFHDEGPFGNHTGHYQPERQCPVIQVTALTRRHDPIIPATVVGQPPMEDCYLAKALERLLLPLLQIDHPEIKELNMPLEGIFHGCAFLAVDSRSAQNNQQLLSDIARGEWLSGSRLLVLFDQGLDVHDTNECFWRAVNNVDFNRDVIQVGPTQAIDATGLANKNELCIRSVEIEQRVSRRWREYGLEGLLNGQ